MCLLLRYATGRAQGTAFRIYAASVRDEVERDFARREHYAILPSSVHHGTDDVRRRELLGLTRLCDSTRHLTFVSLLDELGCECGIEHELLTHGDLFHVHLFSKNLCELVWKYLGHCKCRKRLAHFDTC